MTPGRRSKTMNTKNTRHCVARFGVLAIAIVTLCSCGNLSVTMEVLNRAVVQRQDDQALISTGIPMILGSTRDSIDAMVGKLRALHRQGIEKIREVYLVEAKNASGPAGANIKALADDLVGSFDGRMRSPYAELARDLNKYAEDLKRTLGAKYTVTPQDPEYRAVLDILHAWQQRVSQFTALVREDVGKYVRELRSKGMTPLALEKLESVVRQAELIDNELAQISLQNSPYAYAVASAPPADWSYGYNQVYTNGSLGATDVAIKLDPATGNYLLKGLSFDPSDVAAVASKVTTQALLIAAQVAGVPVKLSTATPANTPGGALAGTSGALADAQARLETRRAQEEARRIALLAIANAIVNELADLDGSDSQRKAAMATIRNAFEKREAILRPATTP
jgi:hypothetical protein